MATITKLYSDIDFNFAKKPVVGDIALSYDAQAVIRSIRNLLLTKHYERFFNPDLGSNIGALLFENIGPITAALLEKEISNVISNYEPRVSILKISAQASPDENRYDITLSFFIINNPNPVTIDFFLERIR